MDVFFDNGVLKNILKISKPDVSENFKNAISRRLVELSGTERHDYISSPIMLLEYSGIKIPPLNDRTESAKNKIAELATHSPFDANKFGEAIIAEMKAVMEKEENFDYNFLMRRIAHEEQYRDPYGIEIARSLFLSNLSNSATRSRFLTEIILDDIQGLDFLALFKENWKENIDQLLGVFATALFDTQLNVSMARILHHWLINVDTSNPASHVANECKYDFDRNRQDRLDTQLVHFCCYGHKRDGVLHKVCGITTESESRIIKRCEAYLSFIAKLNNSPIRSSKVIPPNPGFIVFADSSTGNLLNTVDVSDIWTSAIEEVEK